MRLGGFPIAPQAPFGKLLLSLGDFPQGNARAPRSRSRGSHAPHAAAPHPPFGRLLLGLGGFVLAWAVILFTLAAAVCGIAGNGGMMASEMMKHAPPETTGLPEKEYAAVGQMTADYLAGRTAVFQHTFSDETGTVYQCFQPHEAAHMADCRKLIRLAEILRLGFGLAGAAIVTAGILMPKQRKGIARGVIIGLRSAGVIGAVLLIWGVIDFDGLFTAFHRIAFTNDGWLLDPRTDLLIRLMPTELFVTLAVRILMWTIAAAAGADIAARCVMREKERIRVD